MGTVSADASSIAAENIQSQNFDEKSSGVGDNVESLDQFVSVKDNQFTLSVPNSYNVSTTELEEAQNDIVTANANIKSDNGIINVNTGEVIYVTRLQLFSASKRRASYEVRHYWWGTRHIYRSNSAVENYCHKLEGRAGTLQGLSLLGIASPGAGVLASATAWYFNNVTNNLRHMNAIHSKDKLVMDVNFSLKYTIKVWHD
ncbi:hypothetical protein [Levilactobacillus cerevisiae]|uniref:hypothetical protein n=1 Tax=Levilactobacillus cerevisiae TaxID=1704076 RepID=UPI000F7A5FD9|nr:hypothetical protein [Levilactobacillus cerevisiae]